MPTLTDDNRSGSADYQALTDSTIRGLTGACDINIAINPLIAASAPLLNLATQLREQTTTPNLNNLHRILCYEIKIFENKARLLNYRSSIILSTRYFICAFLDEVILTSTWGENSEWQERTLMKTFQQGLWNDENFFILLERYSEEPKSNLDLLELAYLCLSLGYEGHYKKKPHSHYELDQLIDRLYYLIRNERGEFSKGLLITDSTPKGSKKIMLRLPPAWIAMVIGALGLIISYIPYRIHLTKLTTPIHELVKNLRRQ